MRTALIGAILALTGLACASPMLGRESNSQASMSAVAALEKSLEMPEGAYPLENYDRYYTVETIEDHAELVGKFYFGGRNHRGQIFLELDDFPLFRDGGCDIIQVYASENGETIHFVACNGVA